MIYQKRSHIRSLEDTEVQCLERGEDGKDKVRCAQLAKTRYKEQGVRE